MKGDSLPLPSGVFLFNFGFVFYIKVSVLPSVRLTLPRNASAKPNTVFLLFFLCFVARASLYGPAWPGT